MADTMHAFMEQRLRIALTGRICGNQLDNLLTKLTHLFKTVRPTITPDKIFIAVSEPSDCGYQYCSCNSDDSILGKYKITIFIDRKEQGRTVAKPWLRAVSTEGFEAAVVALMAKADELVAEVENLGKKREPQNMRRSSTSFVDVLEGTEERRRRGRGFTL